MTKVVALVALMFLALGCVEPGAVSCPDNRTCPSNTVCHPTLPLCVLEVAKVACEDKADTDRCNVDEDLGICEAGYCVAGCGDGQSDEDEECDDGNYRSNDGCSSACVLEQRSWTEWHAEWVGRSDHALAYHAERKELVMLGGADDVGRIADQWTRNADLTWTRSVSEPTNRSQAMMAYDSTRKKIVLFGGAGVSGGVTGALADTWEYDGTWTQIATPSSPPGRRGGSMTFDATRGRMVLFGGILPGDIYKNDLWEYDGATWEEIDATSTAPQMGNVPAGALPGGRAFAAFAWDATRNKIVLFSGSATGTYDDAWEYSNAVWSPIVLANAALGTRPVRRYGAAFAYSPARAKLVLYGGLANNTIAAADTWEYDGVSWTPISTPAIPPARSRSSFAFDTERNALVLVAGVPAVADRHEDAWELTAAGAWVNISPRFFPTSRQAVSAFDAARGQVVVFGGFGQSNAILGDTWLFDGIKWFAPPVSNAPPARYSQQLTYDATRDRVVMFGGARLTSSGPVLTDTQEWDGSSWTPVTAPGPGARALAGMADIPGPGVVMFSGLILPGSIGMGASYQETWEFDGSTWAQTATPGELKATTNAPAAYDPVNERAILFSTDGSTWAYANHAWSLIAEDGPGTPGKRINAAVIYDPWLERIVLYGGSSPDMLVDYADLWELVGDVWQPIPLFGAQPATRLKPVFSSLPAQRSLLLFGGSGRDDTWFLKYVSSTPAEDCTDDKDNDGDRQVDVADPDCR